MILTLVSQSLDAEELQAELVAAGFDMTVVVTRPPDTPSVAAPVDPMSSDDWVRMMSIMEAHRPSTDRDLDQLVAKARNVWQGSDTFTQPQAQKILAGLVLIVARHLR
jgi:hypothetical protein